MFDEIQPTGLSEADDSSFAGAVNAYQGFTTATCLGSHIDDFASLAAGHHRTGNRLQGKKHAFGIDRKLLIKAFLCDLKHRRHVEDRSVIDQNIDTAEALRHSFYHGVDRGLIADI